MSDEISPAVDPRTSSFSCLLFKKKFSGFRQVYRNVPSETLFLYLQNSWLRNFFLFEFLFTQKSNLISYHTLSKHTQAPEDYLHDLEYVRNLLSFKEMFHVYLGL